MKSHYQDSILEVFINRSSWKSPWENVRKCAKEPPGTARQHPNQGQVSVFASHWAMTNAGLVTPTKPENYLLEF